MWHGDGAEWAGATFGEHGPRLRSIIPGLVQAAHDDMAVAQDVSGVRAQHVYGVIWRRTLEEFVRVLPEQVPGCALLRPWRAGYTVVTVNGVALYPWRYAKDPHVDPEQVRLGTPPSGVRTALFTGRAGAEQLMLDLGAPDDAGAPDEPSADRGGGAGTGTGTGTADGATRSMFVELARRARLVVVVWYASTAYALQRVRWGDGHLRADGTIGSDFVEDLDLPPPRR